MLSPLHGVSADEQTGHSVARSTLNTHSETFLVVHAD